MSFNHLLNALIVDSSSETRSTLKGLLESDQNYKDPIYQSVTAVNSISEATSLLTSGAIFDVIFISLKIEIPKIEEFIVTTRINDPYKSIAFILACNAAQEHDKALVAQGMAIGADAFLLFPCSIEQLHQVSSVAQLIKIEAHGRKTENALKILIDTFITEIEKRVEILYDDGHPHPYSKHLKVAAKNILEENKDMHERYIDLIVERVANANPRIILPKVRLPKSKSLQEKIKQRLAKTTKA